MLEGSRALAFRPCRVSGENPRLFGIVSSDLIEIPNNLMHSLHISQLHLEQLIYVSLDVFSFARCRSGRARVQVGVDLNRLWHS